MLDLLIINPGAAHGIFGGHAIYGDLGDSLIAVEPPLWCRLIAGYVRDRKYSVEIYDAEALKASPASVAAVVAQKKPRLVAIAVYGHQPSASTQQMVGASATAKEIKKLWPESKIIMLGGHVSALPERTLREEAIDFACVGEGPITITALLGKGPSSWFYQVPGLVWWNCEDGKNRFVKINPRAPDIPLDELHGDAWDLLPMQLYKSHNWQVMGSMDKRIPYASVYTTLNCPFACSFCCISSPFGNRKYRMRDPNKVVAEIKFLRDVYGVKTFKIIDEMFVLNERHYNAIAAGLIEINRNDELNIWAYSRIDTVKPDNLSFLRQAGIKWLALGIESGSKYVRDGSNKRLKNDDIVTVVRTIQDAGINVIGNYIFGLPDDDLISMQQTLDLALSLNTEFANFYSAQAYPGSPLYTQALAAGWTLPETWGGYSQHNETCRPLDTQFISGAEVLKFRDEAFTIYFSNPKYQDMVLKKFGQETLDHIKQMLRYKLKRNLLDQTFAPKERVFADETNQTERRNNEYESIHIKISAALFLGKPIRN